eukprot:snap_masked-scaffold_7-processed-gene-1.26-mRNA-1 protein AED:1.00 eAED:1.00 QI:0/0/0/0/1/1/2/0/65
MAFAPTWGADASIAEKPEILQDTGEKAHGEHKRCCKFKRWRPMEGKQEDVDKLTKSAPNQTGEIF